MIARIEGLGPGVVGWEAKGKVTREDYQEIIVPDLDAALGKHSKVRVLCFLGPQFSGYDLGAAWEDAMVGIHHWNGFERVAVVSDVTWVQQAVKFFGLGLPCPVRVFSNSDLPEAKEWIREGVKERV